MNEQAFPMHTRWQLVFILLASCQVIDGVQAETHFEYAYKECAQATAAPGDVAKCLLRKDVDYGARLEREYTRLKEALVGDSRRLLIESQRAWVKFQNSDCSLAGTMSSRTVSDVDAVAAAACALKTTLQRLDGLVSLSSERSGKESTSKCLVGPIEAEGRLELLIKKHHSEDRRIEIYLLTLNEPLCVVDDFQDERVVVRQLHLIPFGDGQQRQFNAAVGNMVTVRGKVSGKHTINHYGDALLTDTRITASAFVPL